MRDARKRKLFAYLKILAARRELANFETRSASAEAAAAIGPRAGLLPPHHAAITDRPPSLAGSAAPLQKIFAESRPGLRFVNSFLDRIAYS
jgi:hypothetical protein